MLFCLTLNTSMSSQNYYVNVVSMAEWSKAPDSSVMLPQWGGVFWSAYAGVGSTPTADTIFLRFLILVFLSLFLLVLFLSNRIERKSSKYHRLHTGMEYSKNTLDLTCIRIMLFFRLLEVRNSFPKDPYWMTTSKKTSLLFHSLIYTLNSSMVRDEMTDCCEVKSIDLCIMIKEKIRFLMFTIYKNTWVFFSYP